MRRDKQINIVCKMEKQKLANDIYKICPELTELGESNWTYLDRLANRLYDTYGYRKSTEVAEEIFAEIHEALDDSVETELFKGSWFNMNKFTQKLAELKKKYTKGGNEQDG